MEECVSVSVLTVVLMCFLCAERYRSLAPMYYRGASSAVVVFDVTNRVRLLSHCATPTLYTQLLHRTALQFLVFFLCGNR